MRRTARDKKSKGTRSVPKAVPTVAKARARIKGTSPFAAFSPANCTAMHEIDRRNLGTVGRSDEVAD